VSRQGPPPIDRPHSFAGIGLDRPLLMGIVNVTPDSFSDGGRYIVPDIAIAHGRSLAAQGADIIDVGGESTRPGAAPVPVEEEIARVIPVVRALAADGLTVSVDTRNAPVMRAALDAGARIINDVTALTHDPDSLAVAAASRAGIILMHIQGEPATMQAAPTYEDVLREVYDWLEERLRACRAAGIPDERLCVDPGIGFGKTVAHNCAILANLERFRGLGVPLLLGVSRKRFIAALGRGESAAERLPGSLAAALAGLARGAQILRVHDVAETAQAVAVWRAINEMK
jgi:dihydropteroate synthase